LSLRWLGRGLDPRGPWPSGGPVAASGELVVVGLRVVGHGMAASVISDVVALVHAPQSAGGRILNLSGQIHLSTSLLGQWCGQDRLAGSVVGTCGGRSSGVTRKRAYLRANGGDTCGRHSYPVEGVVLDLSPSVWESSLRPSWGSSLVLGQRRD
jgi:hypothetical protein